MNKKPLGLLFLFGALIALVLINHIFLTTNLYIQISWLDIPMHFTGGLLSGLIGIYFLSLCLNTWQKMSVFFILIISLVSALFLGGLWEVVEFNSETILNLKLAETITCEDTRDDLFFDGVGAIIGAILFILFKKRNERKSSPLLDKK